MDYEAFKDHRIWKQIQATQEVAAAADPTPDAAPIFARVLSVLAYLQGFRTEAHAALLSEEMLSEPVTHISNVQHYLTSNPVPYASGELDTVLAMTARWGAILPPARRADQARAATEALTKVIERQLQKYSTQAQRFDEEAEALKAQVKTASARLTEIETLASTAATRHQEAYQEAEQSRATQHAKALEGAGDELRDMLDSATADAAKRMTSMDKKLAEAQRHLDSVEKVVSKTAAAVLARDHGSYANRELVFGLLAYGVGVAGIVWGANVVLGGLSDIATDAELVTWQWLAAKLSFGALIGAGSTVAFQLGGRFIKSSSATKRRELELRAIIPFLAEVEAGKAEDAKLAFLDRTFGREPEDSKAKSADADDAIPAPLLERVLGMVTTAMNRSN